MNISDHKVNEANSQRRLYSSFQEGDIDRAIDFSEKVKLLVADNGIAYIKQKAFINALADFNLFANAPAYKNALLLMLENGLIERLIDVEYSHYRLEIDRFCEDFAVKSEVIYFLSEAIAVAIGKTSSFQHSAPSSITASNIDYDGECNVFIPTKDENFIPLYDIPKNISFNDIAKFLGHDTNQFFIYGGYQGKPYIAFESFTGKILYVYVNEKAKSLKAFDLKETLKGYSFTEEYSYSKYVDDIEEGIQKGNLTKDFFKKLLNQDSDVMIDSRFNTKLIFKDGKLVKMESLDSLSKNAKDLRDTATLKFNRIKKYAESYSFSQEVVNKEINMQVDAFYNMPISLFDNLSEFYVEVNADIWSINYVMCAVAYAKKQINFEEFKLISHEEYSKIGEYTSNGGINFAAYQYLNYICFFDLGNGNFICCYKNGEQITPNSNFNPYYLDKF